MSTEVYPIFDKQAAFDRIDHDTELYCELVEMFFEDLPPLAMRLSNFSDLTDNELIATAHSLKSALGNLGAMQAFQSAKVLEDAVRFSGRSSSTETQVQVLLDNMDAFKEAVSSFLKRV